MTQHIVVGRLGPTDRPAVPTGTGAQLDLQLMSSGRLNYGISDSTDDLLRLGLQPTEVALDLVVLAAHVFAADTRIPRTLSQDSWTREIRLIVPVSAPALWQNVEPVLGRMLNFLTSDLWQIEFRPRPQARARLVAQRTVRRRTAYDALSLFSGGLDSLIGAIDIAAAGTPTLLVSHAADGATSKAQAELFTGLRRHYQTQTLDRLRTWMVFPKGLGPGLEDTTRSRSFLFFALGVLAGSGFPPPFTLRAPENGFIAINVPMDVLRLGALSTRTTHPFYIARWNELLDGLSIQGHVENPYWDRTKGEMASNCSDTTLLATLVAASMSCSAPTKHRWQGLPTMHCGYCLPCLIRRSSLEAALGRANDPTRYFLADLAAFPLSTRQTEGRQVRSLQVAIARAKANPLVARAGVYRSGPLTDLSPAEIGRLQLVYHRGLMEVDALLANVTTTP